MYNYHTIHQCLRCKQLFDSAAILEVHTLAPDSCQVQSIEHVDGITSKVKEQLQCRKKAYPGQTEPERWVQIYKIIFQPREEDDVPSPCKLFHRQIQFIVRPRKIANSNHFTDFEPVQDQESNRPFSPESQMFSEYEEHFRRELPLHFQAVVKNAVGSEVQPVEERLQRQFMSYLEKAQDLTFSSFRARHNVSESTQIREPPNSGSELGEGSTALLETFFRPFPQIDHDSLPDFSLSEQNIELFNLKDDQLVDSAYVSASSGALAPPDPKNSRKGTEEPMLDDKAGLSSSSPQDQNADNQGIIFRDGEAFQADYTNTLTINDVLSAPYQLTDDSLAFNDDSWMLNFDNIDFEQTSLGGS